MFRSSLDTSIKPILCPRKSGPTQQEEAELKSLVKIYETMKPKDAARILQDLDTRVLLSIMELMKERSSASVLAAMDAPTVRIITTQLARRKVIDPPNG